MTKLQKFIRNTVNAKGSMHIRVGKGSPATMATINALLKSGYKCALLWKDEARPQKQAALWIIEYPFI